MECSDAPRNATAPIPPSNGQMAAVSEKSVFQERSVDESATHLPSFQDGESWRLPLAKHSAAALWLSERKRMLQTLMRGFRQKWPPIKGHYKLVQLVKRLEDILCNDAKSVAEYSDLSTLKSRLETIRRQAAVVRQPASLLNSLEVDHVQAHLKLLRSLPVATDHPQQRERTDTCPLCQHQALHYNHPIPRCTDCGNRLRKKASYYTDEGKQMICSSCFAKSSESRKTVLSREILRDDDREEEPWVQCSRCDRWTHQVCALFNSHKNANTAAYVCPGCDDIRLQPKTPDKTYGARELPETDLSKYLQMRLRAVLGEELAKVRVREVSKIRLDFVVKPRFSAQYPSFPNVFPGTSRCILLFQEIDGVDVVVFGMYVYEYGLDCPEPNRGRIYISYLDSVNHFRPPQLRTRAYHELLINYCDHAAKRGFKTVHLWACPPVKGDDFLFFCHPTKQKIPSKMRLREWYLALLATAQSRGIVTEVTNFWDFISATDVPQIPYFEGDYWPDAAEDILAGRERRLRADDQAIGDYSKVHKKRKRTIEEPAHDAMKTELGKYMKQKGTKENFIVARLKSRPLGSVPIMDPDNQVSIESIFGFRNRFLTFCQDHHFQWNDLRHAKYATAMVLYHVFYSGLTLSHAPFPHVSNSRPSSTVVPLIQKAEGKPKTNEGRAHPLPKRTASTLSKAGFGMERRKATIAARIRFVEHATYCKNEHCKVSRCRAMKDCLRHVATHSGSTDHKLCMICRRVRTLLTIQARVRRSDVILKKWCSNTGDGMPPEKKRLSQLDGIVGHVSWCTKPDCAFPGCATSKRTLQHFRKCRRGPDCSQCRSGVAVAGLYNRQCLMRHHVQHFEHSAKCRDASCTRGKCKELKDLLQHVRSCSAPDRNTCKKCNLTGALFDIYVRYRSHRDKSESASLDKENNVR